MAVELNPPGGYILEHPDGTRVVIQDSSDPDFVGYLRDISGTDSADVRENADDLPGADGGVHGDFFHGRRPVTLDGFIVGEGLTAAARNDRINRLLRVTRALREDMTLRWTESGGSERRLLLRRQQPTRITDRLPKSFLVAMVAANPRIESTTEQSQFIDAGAPTGSEGFPFPLSFPIDFEAAGTPAASATITTYGNCDCLPRFRIDGPITNPRVRNETTGEEIALTYDVPADQYLTLDAADHSIKLNGDSSIYSALDFANSIWWNLQPGSNTVKLLAPSFGSPAALTVYWRDSWL